LESVTLGSGLQTIGEFAFYPCDALKTVTCLATTPPTLGASNFRASDDALRVRSGSLTAYTGNATWKAAFMYIVALP
jgi:hypothetical protein